MRDQMSVKARMAEAAERRERGTRQEVLDTFYHRHGPCCSGCDWWRSISSIAGECHQTAMIGGAERWAAIGITNVSMPLRAGHCITRREHVCGQFRDEFDWSSLPLPYRKRVGDRTLSRKSAPPLTRSENDGGRS